MDSNYIVSATKAQQFPEHDYPEFAFVGKSNCGKSSLLNALFERKSLARKSATPGRTQMINFFSLKLSPEKSYIFADLPGYGFSKTSKSLKAFWSKLIGEYLETRNLAKILFLFDARREIEAYELSYLNELRSIGKEVVVVMTKTDKLNQSEKSKLKKKLKSFFDEYRLEGVPLVLCSTLKKNGIRDLQKILFETSLEGKS